MKSEKLVEENASKVIVLKKKQCCLWRFLVGKMLQTFQNPLYTDLFGTNSVKYKTCQDRLQNTL